MQIWLRSSLLDEDCDRRLAAKQWPKLLEKHGFELTKRANNIGAALGRAAHRVFAAQLRLKRDAGVHSDYLAGVGDSMALFDQEVKDEGIEVDQTTPSRDDAVSQIAAMAKEFNGGYLPYATPQLIEEELAIWKDRDRQVMLTTTPDHCSTAGDVDDFKTGAREPVAPYQLGQQAIILAEHGYKAKRVSTIWIPRPGNKDLMRRSWPLKEAKEAAESRVEHLVASFREYEKERSPLAFDANPQSMTCDKRFCPAFATAFCPLTKEV